MNVTTLLQRVPPVPPLKIGLDSMLLWIVWLWIPIMCQIALHSNSRSVEDHDHQRASTTTTATCQRATMGCFPTTPHPRSRLTACSRGQCWGWRGAASLYGCLHLGNGSTTLAVPSSTARAPPCSRPPRPSFLHTQSASPPPCVQRGMRTGCKGDKRRSHPPRRSPCGPHLCAHPPPIGAPTHHVQ